MKSRAIQELRSMVGALKETEELPPGTERTWAGDIYTKQANGKWKYTRAAFSKYRKTSYFGGTRQRDLGRHASLGQTDPPAHSIDPADIEESGTQKSRSARLYEASELDLADLSKDRKDLLKSVFPNGKLDRAWQGVHGTIVELVNPNKRIPADALKLLVRSKLFRWIEVDGPDVTIGF